MGVEGQREEASNGVSKAVTWFWEPQALFPGSAIVYFTYLFKHIKRQSKQSELIRSIYKLFLKMQLLAQVNLN